MERLLENIKKGGGYIPPEPCLASFREHFSDAVNIEWFEKKPGYEAVFYREKMEYIAHFGEDCILIEYKMFLPQEFLPTALGEILENRGEIMNAVLINKGNSIEYEIIYRDHSLTRHLLLLTDLGKILEEKVL
jgi:hypothetical protein